MLNVILLLGVTASALTSGVLLDDSNSDPFTAFFDHDWASVGGWSLFVSLVLFVVVGSFREWWVPGPRNKRNEALILTQQNLIKQLADQVTKLTESNEFTKYVMEQVVPRPSNRDSGSTVARRSVTTDPEESAP
jgi:hypothetical protein